MAPILAFDIETIPDTDGIRVLHNLPTELADAAVAELAFQKQRAKNGSDFLPHHLQRVLAISCVLRYDDARLKVWTIGHAGDSEASMIQAFFDGLARFTPQLVSWNGGGFDLPVLHYRALKHGISAPRYWDWGDEDRDFKWNNYLSRYHTRHLDLMDLLALYQARAYVPLDEMAKLCGFPGKLGMDGSQVWPAYQQGQTDSIRNYCETDAMNTYLVYLRFRLMRGELSAAAYQAEIELARTQLSQHPAPHWAEFLQNWPQQATNGGLQGA
jgi:3'-5' exonuclease